MKAPEAEGMPRLDISREELEALLEQARQEPLREEGYQKLRAAIRTLHYVTELLEKKETTLKELRELLCPASTEKTEKVLQQAGIETGDKKSASPPKKPRRGHGRNAAAAYHGAKKSPVPPASLKPGDACPDGCGGKVYPQREPGVLVRIKGQPPLAATIYELEKLRCNLCGKVYTADAPPEAGEKKYDETAVAMMALLRYGTGVPWNRTEASKPTSVSRCRRPRSAKFWRRTRSRSSQPWRNSSAKLLNPEWSTTTTPPCACSRWIGIRIFRPSGPECSPAG
jgi:transposase